MYQTNENKAEEVLIPAYNLFDFGVLYSPNIIKTKQHLVVASGLITGISIVKSSSRIQRLNSLPLRKTFPMYQEVRG